MTRYRQAWECKGPKFNGLVYTQEIALNKLADGCDIVSVTIIRHADGRIEFERGTIAAYAHAYRETVER